MGLVLAFKAFLKAWKEPEAAKKFLKEEQRQEKGPADQGHLRLLMLLQQSGRLVDFFKEDISACSDAQVGVAVRKIHEECRKKLEELITIRPIFEGNEGSKVQVAAGYDAAAIKLVGKVKGEPPFHGILVHKGWKAHKRSLPKFIAEQNLEVLCPAEIEIT